MPNIFRKEKHPPKWCPGCGDYVILNTLQCVCEELGLKTNNTIIVSGIGCSSRLPYHFNSFGYHTIHGRAPTIAIGLAITRPDLNIIVITGDGDGLSIGLSHLSHVLRKNPNLTILLFNNEIYGLTKGQQSPTSRVNTVTVSTPDGSIDRPVNAVKMALASGASFIARGVDFDRHELKDLIKFAIIHRGASFLEILQNCIVFNDKVYESLKERRVRIVNRKMEFTGSDNNYMQVAADTFKQYIDKEIGDSAATAFHLADLDADNVLTGIFLKNQNDIYPSIKLGRKYGFDSLKRKIID